MLGSSGNALYWRYEFAWALPEDAHGPLLNSTARGRSTGVRLEIRLFDILSPVDLNSPSLANLDRSSEH